MKVEKIQNYWKHPDSQNDPRSYIDCVKRSEFLFNKIQPYIHFDSSILELGCNVGRNLNYLFQKGYSDVSGVDINSEIAEIMPAVYPELTKVVKLTIDSLENFTPTALTNSYDLVFSMACLMHIHPDNEFIFGEIARICEGFLIIIETECKSASWRIFRRNYTTIFTNLGMDLLLEEACPDYCFGKRYVFKIFKKK